ncbi:MAG: SAM-dependent DNA methyltransferase, partial [Chloroflexi bacterium]|nr:SAM-dependent DNA methyltransferase [Chloroflexota bacterium]
MSSKPKHIVKKNGVFYTPGALARVLADGSVDQPAALVLDPACGTGALLSAVEERCTALGRNGEARADLYGCDRLTHKGFPEKARNRHFVKMDFFAWDPRRRFDVVVMNPPFLSVGEIAESRRRVCRSVCQNACRLPYNADAWAYFIVKAVGHLRPGGNLGAILPWSFLQADYAAVVRKWLADRFRAIKVLVLTAKHFQETNTRVLLVWLKGHGAKLKSLSVGFSESPRDNVCYHTISGRKWAGGTACFAPEQDVDSVLRKVSALPRFARFGEIARVCIGVVTGANGFFVLARDEAKRLGIPRGHLVPVLTSSRALKTLTVASTAPDAWLLKVPAPAPALFRGYLAAGRRKRVHLRSHCQRRTPWYSVDPGPTPDAFFQYRVSSRPFLALNVGGVQSTNSVHRVYFDGTAQSQRRWAQVSLLSVIGQLSIEARARTYGNGMLKVEPKCLKAALVFLGHEPMSATDYESISHLLSQGDKAEAEKRATHLLQKAAKVPEKLIREASLALQELRSRR